MKNNPYEIDCISGNVFYYEEDGTIQSFSVKSKTIDTFIEKLGTVERKLEMLKRNQIINSVNKDEPSL